MIAKLKRIIFLFVSPNSTLRTKTKLKLLPVTGRHLELWAEGFTSEGWGGTVENFTHIIL